ncbi:MAG: hypothetical protein AAFY20_06340 [Cyanobacteria bacterium J06639_14]
MQDFPIRNIFLPAALAASAVFSALTLPTALQRSTTHAVDLPTSSQQSQMDLSRVHKDIAIPYIGTVIVLSAGAGIATAELVRKWHAARKSTAAQTPEADFADSFEDDSVSSPEIPSSITSLPLRAPDFAWPTSKNLETASSAAKTWVDYDFPKQFTAATWETPAAVATVAQAPDMTVVIFPGQYQRCRIQVPSQREQSYAIEFDEKFYSLLSAGVSKEQALAAITQLDQENRPAILTQMNEGYAVWVLEPEAQLISVA